MLLAETEPIIRRLAQELWSALRKESRMARTVVLHKLKTSEFKILTRSHTPGSSPSSYKELDHRLEAARAGSISIRSSAIGSLVLV